MVRMQDAPPAGWYPDPSGSSGLRWWDGLDWTEHRRPPASSSEVAHAVAAATALEGPPSSPGPEPDPFAASELRTRARRAEQDAAAVVAEARRAAREEVDRAVKRATSQLDDARSRYLPLVEQWRTRVRRWARVAAIVVVLLVALSAWLNATASVGLLEWLGERIDAVTATSVTTLLDLPEDRWRQAGVG